MKYAVRPLQDGGGEHFADGNVDIRHTVLENRLLCGILQLPEIDLQFGSVLSHTPDLTIIGGIQDIDDALLDISVKHVV